MSISFRKTIVLGPLRLNIFENGLGLSFSIPGARLGKTAAGKTYVSAVVPGTGLQYKKYLTPKRFKK